MGGFLSGLSSFIFDKEKEKREVCFVLFCLGECCMG